ncbi:UNVERIFIED_CONTAM: hypothetical protein HDU68_000600 [Siphonaria sp. JEL0065]|nr:hypothetical protein HDU68_000600 [Siphonaria sp. JEL0065]
MAQHIYGSLDIDLIAKEPDKPYEPFEIEKIVEVQGIPSQYLDFKKINLKRIPLSDARLDDPRGVTKLVLATRDVKKGEILGMYDGQYMLDCEHSCLAETSVLNAFEREYKLHTAAFVPDTARHYVPKSIINKTGVQVDKTKGRNKFNNTKRNKSPRKGQQQTPQQAGNVASLVVIDGAECRGTYGWASEINDYRKLHRDEDTVNDLVKLMEKYIPMALATVPTLIKEYNHYLTILSDANDRIFIEFANTRDSRKITFIQSILDSNEKVGRVKKKKEEYEWGCRRRGILAPARIVAAYFHKNMEQLKKWIHKCKSMRELVDSVLDGVGVEGIEVRKFNQVIQLADVQQQQQQPSLLQQLDLPLRSFMKEDRLRNREFC